MPVFDDNNDSNTINATGGADTILGNGGDDTIIAGAGPDLVSGGSGDDSIDGAGGNDTLYGDQSAALSGDPVRESFEWDQLTEAQIDGSATQDTGNVTVTYTRIQDTGNHESRLGTDNLNTSGINSGGETVDGDSSLYSETDGQGNEGAFQWEFSDPVENVSFNVNDIDGDALVRITAYDMNGLPIPVSLVGGSGLTLIDTDTVAGTDTADSNGGYANPNTSPYNLQVTIAGPVSRIVLEHDQNGPNNSGINVTDIYYDADVASIDTGEAGDDDIDGGEGDDLIFGQGGDDTIDGGPGDDVIYGDNGTGSGTTVGELLVNGNLEAGVAPNTVTQSTPLPGWQTANGAEIWGDGFEGEFSQDGGNFVELDVGNAVDSIFQDVQTVDGETYTLTFDAMQRIEGSDDQIEVYYDGVLIDTVQPGDEWQTYSFDVTGGGSDRLELREPASDNSTFGPLIDNVSLVGLIPDSIDGDDGNDSIDGGEGEDTIFGEGGDDIIMGGAGADVISGGDGRDTFIGGTDGDDVDGGAGGDDFDTLDLRGLGAIEIVDEVTDADGNSTSGTINFLDTGGSMAFSEIEEILSDPSVPGPVDGLDDGELMEPDYTDAQGDQIDGTDGDDDTIFGNGGNDTIDSGDGNDTVDGGDGDDRFVISESGSGIDNDVIIGGEGDEIDGDTLDITDVEDDLYVDIYAPETGTVTDGVTGNVTNFSEIENIVLGAGDDTVMGSTGDDNVDSGGGNDSMFGGAGNDTLSSGDGLDTIDGGIGDDSLTGGDEADSIIGGEGDDTLIGGRGPDTLDGGAGDDSILGGADDDSILGGDGNDVVEDLGGNNIIDTSGGDNLPDIGFPAYGPFPAVPADSDPDDDRDFVTTGSGNDSITTGDDADTIISGGGNDTINSGIDDDYVEAGSGADLVTTGEGNDTVFGGDGNDTIYGGLGPSFPSTVDIPDAPGTGLFGPDPEPNNGRDYIDGGRGNDLIYGEDDDDTLIGGSGADTLDGGIDDDLLQGGVGQDDMIGGQGADTMEGGDDRDFFIINERTDAFGDVIDGGTGGNDVDRLTLTGLGRFEIVDQTTDADGDSTSGTVNFLDALGNIEGSLSFTEIEQLVICFTPGTAIATPRGEIDVANLQIGDRVITRDNGVQEISWIGRKKLGAADLIADPKLRPVLIKKGSLGNNLPERDMMVSPNHRMLMANSQTQVLFDEREVLVASKYLVGQPGIFQLDTLGVEYVHVMFENHEVILGDGTWTESFQPGDHSLGGIDEEQRDEIFKLFPSLQNEKGRRAYSSARQSLKAHEAKMLRETMGLV